MKFSSWLPWSRKVLRLTFNYKTDLRFSQLTPWSFEAIEAQRDNERVLLREGLDVIQYF